MGMQVLGEKSGGVPVLCRQYKAVRTGVLGYAGLGGQSVIVALDGNSDKRTFLS